MSHDDDYQTERPYVAELHRDPRQVGAGGAVMLLLGVLLVGVPAIMALTGWIAGMLA